MFGFILGFLIAGLAFWLVSYVRRQRLKVPWWGWLLAALWLLFSLFVVATAYTLIAESAVKAALIILLTFGVVAVIAAVLLARFVFASSRRTTK